MHILTKIFIVLVSFLAVLLVPLVVVYAHNENSYQARYQEAEARAQAATSAFEASKLSQTADALRKDQQIQDLEALNLELRRLADQQETKIRELAADAASAEDMDGKIQAHLSQLSQSFKLGQELTQSLIDELRGLRREALASERQIVDLDDALRDKSAQLDAADEARRALREELQRLKDEHADALARVQQYVARFGEIDEGRINTSQFSPVDRSLDCTIISVRRNSDQTLAEIDAGSRDGVKEGWIMTVGRSGQFLGRIRIISVDINRSTGVVELENEAGRGRVEPGDHVYARPSN